MRMIAVLKNREHPEYGELSLPLPIKASEYDHTMDMLADLGIGDVLKRDCEIIELSRTYVASSMINQEVPIDTVKEILGHTQIGSMKAYMRISRDKLAMCALGLDGIEVVQEALL